MFNFYQQTDNIMTWIYSKRWEICSFSFVVQLTLFCCLYMLFLSFQNHWLCLKCTHWVFRDVMRLSRSAIFQNFFFLSSLRWLISHHECGGQSCCISRANSSIWRAVFGHYWSILQPRAHKWVFFSFPYPCRVAFTVDDEMWLEQTQG